MIRNWLLGRRLRKLIHDAQKAVFTDGKDRVIAIKITTRNYNGIEIGFNGCYHNLGTTIDDAIGGIGEPTWFFPKEAPDDPTD